MKDKISFGDLRYLVKELKSNGYTREGIRGWFKRYDKMLGTELIQEMRENYNNSKIYQTILNEKRLCEIVKGTLCLPIDSKESKDEFTIKGRIISIERGKPFKAPPANLEKEVEIGYK